MLQFQPSEPLTIGVELELQIVNRRDYNLTRGASDLLMVLEQKQHDFDIKPEITESMIEIASRVHHFPHELYEDLKAIQSLLIECADKLNLALAGGGTHPFQYWHEQEIFPHERYRLVSELYGYLAKQFTVYGQHIHIGCKDSDDAILLAQCLARYIPHFIALSASSPFYQGVDTLFQSSRLTSINAFPLSGHMPYTENWQAFNAYFESMQILGIVASMKDFYWDIRPKPEYGTVEIRVCDTPLSLRTAALLAAYAQLLAQDIFENNIAIPEPSFYVTYNYNRFQACRFGLEGIIIDPIANNYSSLKDDILQTIARLQQGNDKFESYSLLSELRTRVEQNESDSNWLRAVYQQDGSLQEVVRQQAARWSGVG